MTTTSGAVVEGSFDPYPPTFKHPYFTSVDDGDEKEGAKGEAGDGRSHGQASDGHGRRLRVGEPP